MSYTLLLLFSNTDSNTKAESQSDEKDIIQFSAEHTIVKFTLCDTPWS